MPALTRRGKRLLPVDLEDEEDGLGNVDAVGILAQRAARREAAREQEAARVQEPVGNEVRAFRFSLIVYIMRCSQKFRMRTHNHQHPRNHHQ